MATTTTVVRPAGKVPPIPPNQTLYVTNLPSAKVQKSDLKTALYLLFSIYGVVLDVVALKTMKMRGQAHIVFRDAQAATQAMRALEGFEFLGRELRIQYAKSKSDTVAKLDGTYKMPGSAAANVEMTETQQSIFNAPPPSSSAAATNAAASTASTTSTAQTPQGIPSRPSQATDQTMTDAADPDNRGQKRPRDEEDSDEDVAMEEDSDED